MRTAQRHLTIALTLALALSVPPRETVAWCRWQLGETAFASGDYASSRATSCHACFLCLHRTGQRYCA